MEKKDRHQESPIASQTGNEHVLEICVCPDSTAHSRIEQPENEETPDDDTSTEEFWAGRNLAARRSARIAA